MYFGILRQRCTPYCLPAYLGDACDEAMSLSSDPKVQHAGVPGWHGSPCTWVLRMLSQRGPWVAARPSGHVPGGQLPVAEHRKKETWSESVLI